MSVVDEIIEVVHTTLPNTKESYYTVGHFVDFEMYRFFVLDKVKKCISSLDKIVDVDPVTREILVSSEFLKRSELLCLLPLLTQMRNRVFYLVKDKESSRYLFNVSYEDITVDYRNTLKYKVDAVPITVGDKQNTYVMEIPVIDENIFERSI